MRYFKKINSSIIVLTSLDLLVSEHEIEEFPALIINNDDILYELDTPDSIEQFLD